MADLDVSLTPQVNGRDWSDDDPGPVRDAAGLAELQQAVAHLADAVTALQGTLTVDTGLRVQTDALTAAERAGQDPATDSTVDAVRAAVEALPTDGLTDEQLRAADVVTRAADRDLRIERYAAATGGQEVRYLGTAPPGTAESAGGWTVKRFDHDADGLIEIITATGAWDDRATLF